MNKIEEHLNNIFKYFITKSEYEMIEKCFIITSKEELDKLSERTYLSSVYDRIAKELKFNSQLLLIETGSPIEGWSKCENLIKRIKSLFKTLKIDHFFNFDKAELFPSTFGYYSGKFVVPIVQMPSEKELEQSYKLNVVEGAIFISRYYKENFICVLRKTDKEIYTLETNGELIIMRKNNSLNRDTDIQYIKENKNTKKNLIKSIISAKTVK